MRWWIGLLVLPWCVLAAQPTQINVSQDLTALGIAAQNAAPDVPTLDSRPLFQAAIRYAVKNGIPRVISDPGAYYFLTPQSSGAYLYVDSASNLTLDLQGSDLYLKSSYRIGISLMNCRSVTLANFTVDFLQLPFTQVRITGVTADTRTLRYAAIGNWPSPTIFNSIPDPSGSAELIALIFRNGSLINATNRLTVKRPVQTDAIVAGTDDSPWTQPAVLATYQPGDTMVVAARGGEAPIRVDNGSGIVLTGIDIYAASAIAVQMDASSDGHVEGVRVLPRPGTDRLISANADGIHISMIHQNTRVRRCYVNRTIDDGIALNSPWIATVNQVLDARTIGVSPTPSVTIPDGAAVAFVNPATGEILPRALINAQFPQSGMPLSANQPVTLGLDTDLPALGPSFGVFLADSPDRGGGSVVENNVVEDVFSARGIFLGGVRGVTVRKNIVRRTNGGGIVAHQDLAGYPTAPNQDVQITGNTVDNAIGPAAVGTGSIAALGSIFVLSTNRNFEAVIIPNTLNVNVANNFISNSGRTGIWVGNVDGGTVQNNANAGYGLYPDLAIWGIDAAWMPQLVRDFTQPIVVHTSRNVSLRDNQ